MAQRALPASVLGPVERCHGFERRMAAAWRAQRWSVQPLGRRLMRPQIFPEGALCKWLVTLDNSWFKQSVCSKYLRSLQVLDVAKNLAKQRETEGLHGGKGMALDFGLHVTSCPNMRAKSYIIVLFLDLQAASRSPRAIAISQVSPTRTRQSSVTDSREASDECPISGEAPTSRLDRQRETMTRSGHATVID